MRVLSAFTAFLFLLSAALNLGAKISLGSLSLTFSTPQASIADFEIAIAALLISAAVISRLYVYGAADILATAGIAEGLLSAAVQGNARILHLTMVPPILAGIALLAFETRIAYARRADRSQKAMNRQIITVLQFFTGGLVTLGGAAYAKFGVYPYGTILGSIHFLIGIISVFAGYAFVERKAWSRNLLIGTNLAVVLYSAFSETMAQVYSLLPPGINDSLIGTIIAIIVSAVILYLILTRQNEIQKPEVKESTTKSRATS